MQGLKLFVDMDGVLTDFEARLKHLGFTGDNWDDNKLWAVVLKIDGFWEYMPWMPDGKVLWNFIKKYKPSVLTAPTRFDPRCKMGKVDWVYRELGRVPVIFSRADEKRQYADPNSILIDDRVDNIKQWNASGGIGIRHINAAKTISELKKILEERTQRPPALNSIHLTASFT